MDAWFVIFGLFFLATLVAIFFGAYLIGQLKAFPEEFRKAGSPSPFWNDGRTWSFLAYVLNGKFLAIPDASLVATFKVFRAFEAVRWALFFGLVLFGLAQSFFPHADH